LQKHSHDAAARAITPALSLKAVTTILNYRELPCAHDRRVPPLVAERGEARSARDLYAIFQPDTSPRLAGSAPFSILLAKSENGRQARTGVSSQPFSLVAYSLKVVKIRISRGLPGFASKIILGEAKTAEKPSV